MTLGGKSGADDLRLAAKKEMLLDEHGQFDAAKAAEHFGHGNGLGQVGRPSDAGGGTNPRETAELTNAIQKFLHRGEPAGHSGRLSRGVSARPGGARRHELSAADRLGATFDPDLVAQLFTMTAHEARVRGTHQALTPVVDVARDPRWGRVEETYGEDPYLVARLGIAAVQGFRATARSATRSTSSPRSSISPPTASRSRATTAPGERFGARAARSRSSIPFQAAIDDGGAMSVMASYNEIDGVPSHANRWLLRDVLRKEWGFTGSVVSDYYAIRELASGPSCTGIMWPTTAKKRPCSPCGPA